MVGHLLKYIQFDGAGLQSEIPSMRIYKGRNDKCNYFEACATHLLPYDTVVKRRSVETKRGLDDIYDMAAEVSSFGDKHGIGNTSLNLWL